jgi:uncharacterized oxidoreductase
LPGLSVFEPVPLEEFCRAVFEALGADAEVAGEVAAHLVGANLAGHDSHGAIRVIQYVNQAAAGEIVPSARPEIVHSAGAVFIVDAHRGFGHFATAFAMDAAVERARQHGVSAGVIRHATHIGRLGQYTERAAAQGFASMVSVGVAGPAVGSVVPFGGAERYLGTNPWSIGVPARRLPPMIFDAATSAVAEGKVRVARSKGAQVPAGAIVDAQGKPSTDPEDLYSGGALLPVGDWAGHKGYGLSVASALLGSLAVVDDVQPTLAGAGAVPPGPGRTGGVFLVAIDPAHFGDRDGYLAIVDQTLTGLKTVRPSDGVAEVLVPGEPEVRSRQHRAKLGVALADQTRAELQEIGQRFRLQFPKWRQS